MKFIWTAVLMIVCGWGYSQPLFEEYSLSPGIMSAAAIHIGDINNDGLEDIIIGDEVGHSVHLWTNLSDTLYSYAMIDSTVNGVFSLVSADINGDGYVDIVGAPFYDQTVVWWEQIPADSSWEKHILATNFVLAHEVFVTDLDQDNDLDVLAASAAGMVSWWANDGNDPIGWERQDIAVGFAGARSVVAADMNNDGLKDVVAAGLDNHSITIWNNTGGTPIVWSENNITSDFLGAHRIQLMDMDFDGDLDILGAAYGSGELAWFENRGRWVKHLIADGFIGAVTICGGDIDNDGDIDILGAAQESDELAIWIRDADANLWNKQVLDSEFDGVWPAALKDLNSDLTLDVVAGGVDSEHIKYWLQVGETVSTKPLITRLISAKINRVYPNPFNPTTTISYSIPERSAIKLTVFDIRGQEVTTLLSADKLPGNYEIQWNGLNQAGHPVSTGVYFCRLQAGAFSQTIKMGYLR